MHVEAGTARAAAHGSAERWAKGEPLSPLDGAPIAVKANIAVEGAPGDGNAAPRGLGSGVKPHGRSAPSMGPWLDGRLSLVLSGNKECPG